MCNQPVLCLHLSYNAECYVYNLGKNNLYSELYSISQKSRTKQKQSSKQRHSKVTKTQAEAVNSDFPAPAKCGAGQVSQNPRPPSEIESKTERSKQKTSTSRHQLYVAPARSGSGLAPRAPRRGACLALLQTTQGTQGPLVKHTNPGAEPGFLAECSQNQRQIKKSGIEVAPARHPGAACRLRRPPLPAAPPGAWSAWWPCRRLPGLPAIRQQTLSSQC